MSVGTLRLESFLRLVVVHGGYEVKLERRYVQAGFFYAFSVVERRLRSRA